MPTESTLTPREAAFVLDEQTKSITKVLDSYGSKGQVVRRRGIKVRQLTRPELVFVLALREEGANLTPKGRTGLFAALKNVVGWPLHKVVKFGSLQLDMAKYEKDLEQRLARYEALKDEIEASADGGDPLIKGTNVEVHRISALFDGGMSADEILHAYPSLTRGQVDSALAYAAANPKHGRPYPKTTFKSALRALRFDFPEAVDPKAVGE